ncbi:MAG: cytochrome c family protein [Rhodobacterales bacterium]|nr:MAG: cytochrome c family protein [Rhodobacterales bacterium]
MNSDKLDTMKFITKALASLVGAILILVVAQNVSSRLYDTSGSTHGATEDHAPVRGYIVALEDTGGAAEEEVVEVTFPDAYASADTGKGEKVFKKCKACHALEPGKNGTGPSLYGVVNRASATVEGFGYSDAMAALGVEWTPEELDLWLADPKGYLPGNKMTFKGLGKIEDRANLIAYLATIGG